MHKGAQDKGAQDKGAGHKGAGHKGAGHKGAGHKGAGHKGAGHKGAGHKGAGHKGAVVVCVVCVVCRCRAHKGTQMQDTQGHTIKRTRTAIDAARIQGSIRGAYRGRYRRIYGALTGTHTGALRQCIDAGPSELDEPMTIERQNSIESTRRGGRGTIADEGCR